MNVATVLVAPSAVAGNEKLQPLELRIVPAHGGGPAGTQVADTTDQAPAVHVALAVPVKPGVVLVPLDVAPLAAPGILYAHEPLTVANARHGSGTQVTEVPPHVPLLQVMETEPV